jgi:hypothetical protein
MGLRTLRRHCHLPAAAALLSVLLYTALVTSHIVSLATSIAAANGLGLIVPSINVGDSGCHEAQPAADKAKDTHRSLPASPAKKCPFCAGYAPLHFSVACNSVVILLDGAATEHPGILRNGQLIASAGSHSWLSRAPPLNG